MTMDAGAVGKSTFRQITIGADTYKSFRKAIEQAAAGNFDEAISTLHEVTRADPDHLQAWNAKAMLYRIVCNKKMADLCTETARSINSDRRP